MRIFAKIRNLTAGKQVRKSEIRYYKWANLPVSEVDAYVRNFELCCE